MKALVVKSTGKNYLVKTEDNQLVNCVVRGKFRLQGIKSTNPLAVGDYVDIDFNKDGISVVVKIYDRKNYLLRKSINLSKQVQVLAANIDRAYFIFTYKDPETNLVFLDRLLAIAESYSVPVTIIFNKLDLLDEKELCALQEIVNIYKQVGYDYVMTSTIDGTGITEFKERISRGVNVLIGNSGVGKSSLVKAIDNSIDIRINEISQHHRKGKHTTIFAQMFDVDGGGSIIDTPGIRGIDFYETKKEEISHYFKDIFKVSEHCKFNNCIHINEPKCAVIQAVKENKISMSRYESYTKIMNDGDQKYR